MSHVDTIKCKVRDLDELRDALPENMELRDKKTFAWWGRFEGDSVPPPGYDPKDYGKCEAAIGFKGETPRNGSDGVWEIGVCKAPDGDGYELLCDKYGTQGHRLVKAGNAIRQGLQANKIEARARKKLPGWKTTREVLPGGYLRIKVRKR